jgi:co-chaperonin GroES (HSP10)
MTIIPTNQNAIIEIIKDTETPVPSRSDGFIIPVDTTTNKTPKAILQAISEDCTDEYLKSSVGKQILFRANSAADIPESGLAIVAINDIIAVINE